MSLKVNDSWRCEGGLPDVLTALDELPAATIFITSRENNQWGGGGESHAACMWLLCFTYLQQKAF